MGIVHQLREAIRKDGRSLNALARDAGIAPIMISRFVRGKRSLTVHSADALCRTLRLELRPVEARRNALEARH